MSARVRIAGVPVQKDESGCWIWPGPLDEWGYGKVGGTGAHRRAWSDHVGPIPEGLELDHLCNVAACVNTEHLELVTPAENLRRKYLRQTHCASGHPYDFFNTYIRPNGNRDCRTCIRARVASYRARRIGRAA